MKTKGALLLASLLAVVGTARADIEFKFGGQISSDIRYRLNGEEIPPAANATPFPSQQRLLKYGFSRNENLIKAQLSLTISDRIKAVADVDFVWYGYSDVNDLQSDTLHERVDPYRLEAHAAYIDIYKILPHLDLRIGRQIVTWGTADKFSPTNNVNTLDLSDPLLFGKAIANDMIRVDWNPWRDLIITAVWVPIFRPAQLPRTAPLALTDPTRPAPVQENGIRDNLLGFALLHPPTSITVNTLVPPPSIDNSQVGLRMAGRVSQKAGAPDASISYYYGRFGIPSPSFTINGPGGAVNVDLMWPRMHVLGFDVAGTSPQLGRFAGFGYWVEGAVIFPQKVEYGVYNDDPKFSVPSQHFACPPPAPAGSVCAHDPVTFKPNGDGSYTTVQSYPEAMRGTVVPSTPFVKLTAGMDYSWNKYLYTNLQYVHGFIDEFGTGVQGFARPGAKIGDQPRLEQRLGEYLVAGADVKVFNDQLLLRFFGAFKVPSILDNEPKFTAVLFPQIAWAVWDATELTVGAFIFLGDHDTKFGDPAAGASEIFAKAKFTY
jgi:hypothetical protein